MALPLKLSQPGASADDREQAILRSMPLVYSIARRLAFSLSSQAAFDDLVSAGTVGLIHAIDNYDGAREASLPTYAAYRIRGAMLDSVRSADLMPRRQRAHVKRVQKAMADAQHQHERMEVSDEEIAAELGVPVEEYREQLTSLAVTQIVSLEQPDVDGQRIAERLAADLECPSETIEREELQQLLEQAVRRLPEEERDLLGLYYHEELSPQEIAKVMQLPTKRVYQIKAQAILRLRTFLNRRIARKTT